MKQVRITQAEIDKAGYYGWIALLRAKGIDPYASYQYDRAAEFGFQGVIVTGKPLP